MTYTFDVTVNGDTALESDETFLVNVTSVSGATVVDGQGLGTIQNDDNAVLSISDPAAITEGNSSTKTIAFQVSLSQPAPAGGVTFDIATADGTATSAGSDYVAKSLTAQSIPAGQSSYTFNVTINGDTLVEPDETFLVNVTNVSNAVIGDGQAVGTIQNDDVANLKLSQIYGGGNNSAATFQHDYVELFNRGTTTVDFSVTPYSIQYAGVGSNFGSSKTNLTSGSLAPGKYFLVQESGGTTNGVPLPTADATGSINIGSTSGKVALVVGTTALSSSTCPGDDAAAPFNPSDATIADFVGYGSTASTTTHCYEGTGPATAPTNTTADYRKAGGCTDTNDNAADFFTATPVPRNSASAANNCAGGAPPNLSINDVTVTEGNSGTATAAFTVSLSAPAQAADVSFDVATQDNIATTANSDYVAAPLTSHVIPAGQTSLTFSVTVNGDTAVEPDETFFVNVTNVSGAAVTDGQGTGTIQNDDLPTLSIDDVSDTEGNSGTKIFSFHVTLSAPAPAAVTFDIATADGTAQDHNPVSEDNDYQARSLAAQTIAQGNSSYTLNVTVNGDTAIEPDETFFVNVSNVAGATVLDGQGQGTITNDDSPILSINDVSQAEGDAGSTTFTFTISSTLPAPAGGITFDVATADGTAQDDNPVSEDNDYVTNSTTGKTITAGNTSTTFDVTVNGDTLVEPNETFNVVISNPSGGGASVGDGTGVGNIQNDDTASLVISQIYGGGGNSGASFQNDFVEIFNRGTTTVDFAVTGYSIQYAGTSSNFGTNKTNITTGTIAPGKYFLIKGDAGTGCSGSPCGSPLPAVDTVGSINLAGTSGKVALVAATTFLASATCPGDDLSSPFNLNDAAVADFVGYGSTAANSSNCYEGSAPTSAPASNNMSADFRRAGGCTDTDDNAADFFTSAPFPRNSASPLNDCAGVTPDLSINDVTVTEGNSGTTTATFTVSLSAPAQGADVTFDIATQDNTATTANSDYVAVPLTTHIIPAGQTSFTLSVTVNGDTAVEPDETFFVNVTNVSGANVTDGQGIGTIQNDDLPALSIDDAPLNNEGNSGTTTFSFTVSLSSPAPAGGVSFDIATQDGTATVADNDYVAQSVIGKTIAAGASSTTFEVTVNGDLNIEPNEDFLVNITNISGATAGDTQGQATIQNDDSPTLSINDVTATEGDTGTKIFQFTVTSTLPAPAGGITFDIATSDGTAQDDNPASEDNDYVAQSLTGQTIPAGQTTYLFSVTVNGDKLVEPDETFTVTISNVSGGGASIGDGAGLGTIQNDDTALLVISQLYGGGGNSGATFQNDFVEIFNRGTTTVNFAVTPYSIQYASATGSFLGTASNFIALSSGILVPGQYFLVKLASNAAIGATFTGDLDGSIDMSATNGKVALIVGTTVATTTAGCPTGVTVSDLVGYGTANCSETTAVAALSATKSALRKNDGCTDTNNNANDFTTPTLSSGTPPRNSTSTINDCNAPPTLTIDNVSLTEGNSSTKTFTFTVSLSKPALAGGVSFDIATEDDSATAGSDYVANSLTNQTIAAGLQTYTFNVTVNGDTAVEADETFFVNVTSVTGATVVDGQGLGTIQNDDTPSLSIDDVTLSEGNSSTTAFNFTVTLSPASNQTVTVNYATADSAAAAPSDYTAIASTQLTFLAGETTKPVSVLVNGDTTIEPDETFTVNLSGATNANIGDSQGVGTITNDDGANVVISQVYAGGGNASAQYTNDFVEIFNRTSTAIDVSNWSIQTATGTGTTWTVTRLCPVSQTCTIGANKYYLAQLASGGAVGAALPTPDAIGTASLAVTGAKVALVTNTTALSGSAAGTTPLGGATCPNANLGSVIDFFGFGTATCFEGSAASAALTNTTAAFRASSGCTDTNANSTDFSAAAPSPRNSASAIHTCP